MPARQHHLVTLALLTVAGLSLALMQTLVVPALPAFQREFETSASWTAWIVTGFLLSSSILTPILGKLGDAHGKKRVLVISLAIFGFGSLGAATAWNLPSLVAFRVVQGAGAAIFPLAFGIIRDEFPPEKVGLGIGTVSSVFGLGGAAGLVLGGVILEHLAWQWLFVIGGLPVLGAVALIARYVPESRVKVPARPDYAGSAALSLALIALLLGVSEGSTWGWRSPGVVGLLAGSVGLLAAWVAIERRVAEPLIDLRTLARPAMAATNAATLLLGFSMTAFFVLLPSFVQVPVDYGFGASPTEAGLLLLPFSAAMMIGGPAGGVLMGRRDPLLVLRTGLALTAGGLVLVAVAHDSPGLLAPWLAAMGLGVAFALGAIGTLVIRHSSAAETGVASGMNSIARTVGASFGAQVVASALSAATPAAGSGFPLERGFTLGFALAAAAAAVALLPTLAFARRPRPQAPPQPARRRVAAEAAPL